MNSRLSFTYTQPSDYKDAPDLLIATYRSYYAGGDADAVHFKFAHILSNIGIDVKYIDPNEDALPLMITGITFKNIPTEADYVITPAPLAGSSMTDDYNGGWTITERDDVKIEFSGNGIGVEPNAEIGHHVFSDSNALLLLPNPDAPTEMILSYTTYEESVAVNRTASVTVPRWNQGLNYTLLLTIFNNRVRFSIEVTDWEETKPIDTTVPRS